MWNELTNWLSKVWFEQIRRRPVRVAELIIAAAAGVGIVLTDEVTAAVTTLIVAVITGEVAQRKTTPVDDPDLDDGHGNMADEIPEIDDGI